MPILEPITLERTGTLFGLTLEGGAGTLANSSTVEDM